MGTTCNLQICSLYRLCRLYDPYNSTYIQHKIGINAGFTYRFDRLKPRASKFGGPPAKVYHLLTLLLDYHTYAVIYIVLKFLNNPSVMFLTQLHSISEYCRILSTSHELCLYWNWLSTLKASSSPEGGRIGGGLESGFA